jgi:hypothetical protein
MIKNPAQPASPSLRALFSGSLPGIQIFHNIFYSGLISSVFQNFEFSKMRYSLPPVTFFSTSHRSQRRQNYLPIFFHGDIICLIY